MAKLLKLRRGTTSQHSSFTGAEGEVTVDTNKDTLVVHDGSTAGGHPVAAEDMANVSAADIKGRLGTTLTNAEINASAAIAGTKISPDFGSQGIQTTGNISVSDSNSNTNNRIKLGNGEDLQLYHNGTDSVIYDSGTGRLKLYSNGTGIDLRKDNGTEMLAANTDGSVDLYHNGSKKLETTSSGITVTGTITGADNHGLLLGNSQDFRIRHTGSHSEITDEGTGNLRLGSNQTEIRTANLGTLSAKFVGAGAVELNHNGSKKFETASTGVTVTGNIGVSGTVDGRDIASDGSKLDGIASGATNVSTENIQDIVGAMVSSNTESGITVTYQDGDGTLDFSVGTLNQNTTGNAATATQLQNARTIAGTSFNGTANININYNNLTNKPTIPTNNNQLTNGAGYITSASFSDVAGGGNFTGDVQFQGGANAANIAGGSDIRFNNGDWTGNATKIQHHNNTLYISGGSTGIIFREGANDRVKIDGSGNLVPGVNNTYNLGSTSLRWANVYTNDLHLSNEGSSNDVDSTWGDWTIQEGESDLFLKNNRSGKKYKFNLTEVS